MAISSVNMNNITVGNKFVSMPLSASKTDKLNNYSNNNSTFASLPASAYKANFVPSFGKYKKVKDVPIYDRDTEMPIRASLLRDNIGDFVSYKLMSGRTELGYMQMNCDSIFKEDKYLCPEPDNNLPEITHLRSLEGGKYYGIGTSLISAAVDESVKRGKGGSVWCDTEQGYAHSLSSYRKYENPIPFYYKMGFKSLDEKIDTLIKKSIETNNLGLLPESTTLILTSVDSEKFRKHYVSNFSFARKIA